MKWIIPTILLLLVVNGCSPYQPPTPEQTLTTSNKTYSLDQLFTDRNGYTVYRFCDNGDYRYYVVGNGIAQMLPTTQTVVDTETDVETVDVNSRQNTAKQSGGGAKGGGSDGSGGKGKN